MNLEQHLLRQMAFSHATFGPGERTKGVIDHIKKELDEVENADGHKGFEVGEVSDKAQEWVDVVILALDGLTRELAFDEGVRRDPFEVAAVARTMIEEKQAENEARNWPDWRGVPTDKAIEHVREAA